MQVFLIAGKDALNWTLMKAELCQGFDCIDCNHQPSFHIHDAGAMCKVLLINTERILLYCAFLKYGIHMPDKQKRRFGAPVIPFANQNAARIVHGNRARFYACPLQFAAQDIAYCFHALQLP